jgi:hypothetical protein
VVLPLSSPNVSVEADALAASLDITSTLTIAAGVTLTINDDLCGSDGMCMLNIFVVVLGVVIHNDDDTI